jgi:ADP-ribose pyrophosphatase YjhB (NUDIX family)
MQIAVHALVFDKGRVLAFEQEPGLYRLPKALLREKETLADAAARSLKKEAGIAARQVQFVGFYDALDRNPSGREVAAVLLAQFWRFIDPEDPPELSWVKDFTQVSFVCDQNLILREQGIFAPCSGRLAPFQLVK